MYYLFFDVDLTLGTHPDELRRMGPLWWERAKIDFKKGFHISPNDEFIFYILYKDLHSEFFSNIKQLFWGKVQVNIITSSMYEGYRLAVSLDICFSQEQFFSHPDVKIYNAMDFGENDTKGTIMKRHLKSIGVLDLIDKQKVYLIDDQLIHLRSAVAEGFSVIDASDEYYESEIRALYEEIKHYFRKRHSV